MITYKRIIKYILTGIFIFSLWIPFLAKIFKFDPEPWSFEKRKLESFPKFEETGYMNFTSSFDKYYNDNFGFRNFLIRFNNIYKVFFWKTSPSQNLLNSKTAFYDSKYHKEFLSIKNPRSILGKDGWFFSGLDNTIENYKGMNPYSAEEMFLWRESIKQKQKWLANKGIYYLFVFVPNKETIYSEYLPDYIRKSPGKTNFEKLIEYIKKDRDINMLDLTEIMLEKKKYHRVYRKTDTHWSGWGIYFAYNSIMTKVSEEFPLLKPIPASEFIFKRRLVLGGDLVLMLGLDEIIEDEDFLLKPKKLRMAYKEQLEDFKKYQHGAVRMLSPDKTLPKAVILHDSFTDLLRPFLSEHFSEVVYFPYKDLTEEIIEKYKPEIVIEEIVERKAVTSLPGNSHEITIFQSDKK